MEIPINTFIIIWLNGKRNFFGEAIADICNKSRYKQKKEWNVTTITEAASTELKNNLKKELTKR